MSILFESILFLETVIIEGRKEDAFKKYPQFIDEIETFIQNDPSKKLKYLDWELKQLSQGSVSAEELVEIVNDFDKFQSTLTNKDIIKYDFATLQSELESVKDKQNKKKEKVEKLYRLEDKPDVDVVYESDVWKVIFLKNKSAACHYGLDTKWCISMKDENHYEDYSKQDVVMYVLINKFSKEKYACAIQRTDIGEILSFEWFDAADERIDSIIQNILGDEYDAIKNALIESAKIARSAKIFIDDEERKFQNKLLNYQNFNNKEVLDILLNSKQFDTIPPYTVIPEHILNYFYEKYKSDYDILNALMKHNINNEILIQIFEEHYKPFDSKLIIQIIKHQNTSNDLLLKIFNKLNNKQLSSAMKIAFLYHENLPKEIIERLKNDNNQAVKKAVRLY